ncbi:MAG: sulfite exporter TauE/SafE family protein [Fuerstiella sp.]|nr:sulfite exporter TauE/SafE family protein [Fuerstiella sp.]
MIEVLTILIIVLAGLIRGAFGFGDALVAMPLLALIVPTTTAAPTVALAALLISIVILVREWRYIEFTSTTVLTVSGLVAIPFGVQFLQNGDDRIVKAMLGIVVAGFAVWSLWRPHRFSLKTDRSAPLFGILAGLLGGAYNTSGPPLVIYGTLRRWTPQQFRASLQGYCLLASVWTLTWHRAEGLLTHSILRQFCIAAPFIVLATVIGQRLTRDVANERFIRWIFVALVLVGTWLLLSSLPLFAADTTGPA